MVLMFCPECAAKDRTWLLRQAKNLHDDPLRPLPVELGIEDALPRALDRAGPLVMGSVVSWCSKQRFQVRVGIVFAGTGGACIRASAVPACSSHVLMSSIRPLFVVVHVDRGGDVHGRDEAEAIVYAAVADDPLYLLRDVHHLVLLAAC